MTKKRKGVSADVLFDDPEFRRRQDERLERLRQGELESKRIFAPLVRRLGNAGFKEASLKEITSRYAPLPSMAVGILLDSLVDFDDDSAKEMVVRQLAASAQPFDGRPLVACFDDTTDGSLRWAVLNTIACAKPHSIDCWLADAVGDRWVERTLLGLGRDVHARGVDDYLKAAKDAAAARQESDRGELAAKEPNGYTRAYGPVLQELNDAGFAVRSIEELGECFAPISSVVVTILVASLTSLDEKAKLLIVHTLENAAEPFDGRPLVACYEKSQDEVLRHNLLRTIAMTKPHSIDGWLAGLDPMTKRLLHALDF